MTPHVQDLLAAGLEARSKGSLVDAKKHFQGALSEAKQLGDDSGRASALLYLAQVVRVLDKDLLQAQTLIEASLIACRQLAFDRGEAYALMELGTIAYLDGKDEQAREWMEQALVKFDSLQDKRGRATVLHQIGLIERKNQNIAVAEQRFQESLMIFESFHDRYSIGQVLLSLGNLIVSQHGDFEYAKQLFGRALGLFEEIGAQFDAEKARQNLATLAEQIASHAQHLTESGEVRHEE